MDIELVDYFIEEDKSYYIDFFLVVELRINYYFLYIIMAPTPNNINNPTITINSIR